MQSRLLSFLERAFPSRRNLHLSDLTKISGGWETDIYAFTLEYEEAQEARREELILRIFPGDRALDKASKEFRAMKLLHEAGYPVPQVFWLETDAATLGQPFIMMEKVNGRLLSPAFSKASEEERSKLLNLFCRLYVQLHALDWRPFVQDDPLYKAAEPRQVISHKLDWMESFVRSVSGAAYDPLFSWLRERGADIRWERLCVTHGDYHGFNILLRTDGRAFVLDWGQVEVSDLRFDLAWTLLLSSTYGNPVARDMILEEYKRLAPYPVEQIEYFEAWAAMRRLWSIAASIGGGAQKLGMRPGAENVMKQNKAHLQTVRDLLYARTGIRIAEIENLLANL